MAIIEKGQGVNVGTTEIPDNDSSALKISSSDDKDYVILDTTNSDERIKFLQEVTVPDGAINNPSLRFTGHNSGFYDSGGNGHIGIVIDGSRIFEVADTHFNRFDVAKGFEIDTTASTATNPVYTFNGDDDTGVGTSGDDALSLIAGGVEAIRCVEAGSAAVVQIKDAIHYNAGTGSDTATTEPVYLADTNATMIVDFSNGNVGDITLAANVTAVKFFNAPADGTVATVTAKITQDSSARTFDYADSAVTVYSDGGSTAVTGEIKFAGGAHHVQSTGSGAVDLVSFTCIPSGSTFNIYAAVIGQAFA